MYIYKLTNNVTGDFYIGKTIHSIKRRFIGHKAHANKGSRYYIHNAMRYYGHDNFSIEIIETVDTQKCLNEREIYWIEKLQPKYNCHEGGQGGSKKGRPDIIGESRENWLKSWNRTGQIPWNKDKTGLGGYKWTNPMTDEHKGKISKIQKDLKSTCIHCGFISNPGNIAKHHNDNCPKFTGKKKTFEKVECPHCHKIIGVNNKHCHFDNCFVLTGKRRIHKKRKSLEKI